MRAGIAILIVLGLGLASASGYWWAERSAPTAANTQSFAQPVSSVPSSRSVELVTPAKGAQTLAEILRNPSPFAKSTALHALAQNQDRATLEATLEQVDGIGAPLDRHLAAKVLLLRLVELDPEAALAKAQTFESRNAPTLSIQLYLSWLQQDADTALAHMEQRPRNERMMVGASLQARNQRLADPTLSRVASVLLGSSYGPFASAISADPEQAWKDALAHKDLRGRQQKQMMAIVNWMQQDPTAAMAAIDELPKHQQAQLRQTALNMWAQSDAQAAFAWLEQQPLNANTTKLQRMLIAQIAQIDVDEAMTLANAMPARARTKAIDTALTAIAQQDPELAMEHLHRSGIPLSSSKAYAHLLSYSELYSPQEALELASELGVTAMNRLAGPLFSRWASQDPATAAAQVARFDDAQLQRKLKRQVVNQWALQDSTSAAAWIDRQPQDERDALRVQLVAALGNVEPMLARQHVGKIRDDQAHDRATLSLLARLAYAPDERDHLLETLRTETAKQRALKMLEQLEEHVDGAVYFPSAFSQSAEHVTSSSAVVVQSGP